MRVRSLFFLFITCIATSVLAQNPFEEFNYQPKIGTLSKGKYIEHFDNDSIVRIGSVMFNTYTKQINGFVVTDTLYSEANLDPTIMSRWMNPDPMSDEFPDKSPYNFVNNNPIRYVDPLGLAPEDIILSSDLTEEERTEILNSLQKLSDDELVYNHDTGRVEIATENDGGSKKNGTGLIRTLVNHENDVTITTDANQVGSMEEATNEANSMNGTGSDSVVTLGSLHKVLVENNGEVSAQLLSQDLALGHELAHSLATMDGVSVDVGKTYVNYFTNRFGEREFERQPIEEYYAVGVSGFTRPASSKRSSYPTENSLRADRNLGRRVSYSNGRLIQRKKKN